MNFSFDKIKYLFQIPLEWFKTIHERIFNAYGTNFIIVKQGYYNGLEVSIDEEVFSAAVNDVVNMSESYVKSVNGQTPDDNGNVEIETLSPNDVLDILTDTKVVNEDYLTNNQYVVMPELTDYVDNTLNDYSTTLEVETYLEENYVSKDELGTTLNETLDGYVSYDELNNTLDDYVTADELGSFAHTVDGIQAVDGVVDFNLSPNKWLKSDVDGHIITTDETPVALSSTDNGYLYSNNGVLTLKQDEYVTLSTDQTITADKTFMKSDIMLLDGGSLTVKDRTNAVPGVGTVITDGKIILNNESGKTFISMSNGTTANDAFIIKSTAQLQISDPNTVLIRATANKAMLYEQPTAKTTDSLAIATCGYVQSCLSGITDTDFTFVSNVSWNGTQIVIQKKSYQVVDGLITKYNRTNTEYINTVAFQP